MAQMEQPLGWQLEFVRKWEDAGAHWGVPKAMLSVHAWLLVQGTPQSTDQIMQVLGLSRGGAHTMLQELVQWKLAYPVKRIGSRQVKFIAEQDVWTMFLAILQARQERELTPVMELASWCQEQRRSDHAKEFGDFFGRLDEITRQAETMNRTLKMAYREDEGWWWKWLFGPLRTK